MSERMNAHAGMMDRQLVASTNVHNERNDPKLSIPVAIYAFNVQEIRAVQLARLEIFCGSHYNLFGNRKKPVLKN